MKVELPNLNAQPLRLNSIPKFDISFFSQAAKLPVAQEAGNSANQSVSNANHVGIGSQPSAAASSAPLTALAAAPGLFQSSTAVSTSNIAAQQSLLSAKNASSVPPPLTAQQTTTKETPSSDPGKSIVSACATTSSAVPTTNSSTSSSLSINQLVNHNDSVAELSFTFAAPTPFEGKLNGTATAMANGTTTSNAFRSTGPAAGDELAFEFSSPLPL